MTIHQRAPDVSCEGRHLDEKVVVSGLLEEDTGEFGTLASCDSRRRSHASPVQAVAKYGFAVGASTDVELLSVAQAHLQ
jgi:hypothetical protein